MKRLFKQLISVLLAAACFGGMIAAAADAPAVEEPIQPNDAAVADTGDVVLPAAEEMPTVEEQVQPRELSSKYTVTIPAGGTATLPQWYPYITKGTVIEVRALTTNPDGATFSFSLQCSNGGGFTYSISEEQTRRMTAPNSGNYSITFSATKAVTVVVKLVSDPN